jgi:hypothetical protein
MKIALIDNMNNNFFSLARYLIDRGYDVDLLRNKNELTQFHPKHDTFDDSYLGYTKQLSWGGIKTYLSTSKKTIREDMKPYSFIIACGDIPAFLNKIGMRVDLIVPYGSDLYDLPFIKIQWKSPISYLKAIKSFFYRRAQNRGVRFANHINTSDIGEEKVRVINKLSLGKKTKYFGIPMVYQPVFSPAQIQKYYQKSEYYAKFIKIREKNDLVVFHHSRHVWSTHIDEFSYKGNDILIRGFAKFAKRNPRTTAHLVLFEYGIDVTSSKQLVKEQGISENVTWFPLMPRKEIVIGMSLANLGTGSFTIGRNGGGTIWETLAIGLPLLHFKEKGNPLLFDYPFIYVKNSEDIYQALCDYLMRPIFYKELGIKGAKWYANYVNSSLDQYCKLIDECTKIKL